MQRALLEFALHKIVVSAKRNVVTTTLAGFLSLTDVAAYDAELRSLFAEDVLQPGYRMLLDVSECAIQSQEVITAFQAHVADCPKASRIAVVTGSSIVRMQVRRVMTQPYMRIFTDRGEAWTWLNGAI